jgi:hypothetical protein
MGHDVGYLDRGRNPRSAAERTTVMVGILKRLSSVVKDQRGLSRCNRVPRRSCAPRTTLTGHSCGVSGRRGAARALDLGNKLALAL